jgi:tetratricopeptide (TPR) repeat protein
MMRSEAQELARRLQQMDSASAFAAGLSLLRADFAEILLPAARISAGRHREDARAQQLLGLSARMANDSHTALDAFARAAGLAPRDPLIAHSHARAALEAGRPAAELFAHAASLAPADGSVLLGRVAALLQEGFGQAALDDLAAVLRAVPQWHEGHRSFAHLAGQLGLEPISSIMAALAVHPRDLPLHMLRIAVSLEARNPEHALSAVQAAKAQAGETPSLALLEAHALSESGALNRADGIFDQLECITPHDASLHARHQLRAGRADRASRLLEPFVGGETERLLWPHLSLSWRITGDERWHWLESEPSLVGVYDLDFAPADLALIAENLRSLHRTVAAPLDQSVRGGTQTDGNLLLRLDPPIRKLREAVMAAVDQHIASLPEPVAGHPTLIAQRKPRRIAGSWSVRLADAGFHVDHVHSQGWLSSAFYSALPEPSEADPHAGWLSLGEARELVPGLEPIRLIEPRPGRLVLFPSTMWHGTRPFATGERLTMAFDIALPQQSSFQ